MPNVDLKAEARGKHEGGATANGKTRHSHFRTQRRARVRQTSENNEVA